MNKKILCYFASYLFLIAGFSQSVGIGTTIPDPSAILDVSSSTQGVLIPRMTYSQIRSLPSPAHSMLLYQTDSISDFYYNQGTPASPNWKRLGENSDFSGNKVSYLDPGISLFTVPPSVYKINFEFVSGGGGAGGTYILSTGISNRGGGGGGGGGFASGIINVTPGEVLEITRGKAGITGQNGLVPTNGTDGDTSKIKSSGITLIALAGGKKGTAGADIGAGIGGSGGHISEINSRVFLKSNNSYSIAGLNGGTGSIVPVGEGGVVHNFGLFNDNNYFTRTLAGGVNVTTIKPAFGKGGDYSPAIRGYLVFYW